MICVIGGSGFYNFLEDVENKIIETPFGEVSVEVGKIQNKDVIFLPRHGKRHSIAPDQINYRANIFTAHLLKTEMIFATNAVGSIRQSISPGSFVTPDHIIDLTHGRKSTFFDGTGLSLTTIKGKKLSGVVHVDVSDLFDLKLRNLIKQSGLKLGMKILEQGTLVVTNGPRFESPAEIKAYGLWGGDFVGMTSAPEAFLAKELGIPYATLAVITNYAAGLQSNVTADEVFELFKSKINDVKSIIKKAIIAS
ncbi:MAG: putative 6-oxopurine nucleoside phosphorylase [Candidatus Heimdallarchaeota archaeon LC_2]|nr:MAG: putative 6-oxopurine nucleoside phosphorylase [Candidatus Heimdallarchaeota archaeon LC_2]